MKNQISTEKRAVVSRSALVAVLLTFVYSLGALSSASASTITLDGYNGSNDDINCAPSCLAFTGPNPGLIELSATEADSYPKAGDPANELELLNELLLQFDPARPTVSTVNKTDVEQKTYTTDLQYFSIKKGKSLWFFENTSGGVVTVTALGDAWSHSTEYGPTVVPLPAAAWLFGSALLGLASVKRKKA